MEIHRQIKINYSWVVHFALLTTVPATKGFGTGIKGGKGRGTEGPVQSGEL